MKRFEEAPPRVRKVYPGDYPETDEELQLTCRACGATLGYRVGAVFLEGPSVPLGGAEASLEDRVGFTGYFHCAACGAGGPWDLPETTVTRLEGLLLSRTLGQEVPLVLGHLQLFDGTTVRYATEGEAHLKGLIAQDPGNAFLWSRLGNLYRAGGRPDLAAGAYRKAVELDPHEIESLHSLAEILRKRGELEESARHFRAALQHAWERKEVGHEMRRAIVRNCLSELLEIHEETEGTVPFSLRPESAGPAFSSSKEEAVTLELHQLDLSEEDDQERLVSLLLREPPPARRFQRLRHRLAEPQDFQIGRPTRNGPCPCGSGRKYKNCCGRAAP
ncbi:MAG: tetratricopeptide repeat protein [Planctomycetes bacterium]|nr:tetratricopeptide repeat protein [Planctomycetota bacterium]